MAEEAKILVVEDEPEIRRFLRVTLSNNGYTLMEATKAGEALSLLEERGPDLVILDLGLPDMDGVDLTRRVRDWSSIPIIVLSARSMEQDKIEALDAGADDYLTKPFGVLELLARIRVALRHLSWRDKDDESAAFSTGDLEVDLASRLVKVEGEEVHLTPTEYKLLLQLVQSPGKVVTQQKLLREVWGPGYANQSHYLRVYMGQLRHKLEKQPARPRYIITEPGVGYRLKLED